VDEQNSKYPKKDKDEKEILVMPSIAELEQQLARLRKLLIFINFLKYIRN